MQSARSAIYFVVAVLCLLPLLPLKVAILAFLKSRHLDRPILRLNVKMGCVRVLWKSQVPIVVFENDLSWSGNASGRLTYSIEKESDAIGSASIITLTSEDRFIHEHTDVNGSSGPGRNQLRPSIRHLLGWLV